MLLAAIQRQGEGSQFDRLAQKNVQGVGLRMGGIRIRPDKITTAFHCFIRGAHQMGIDTKTWKDKLSAIQTDVWERAAGIQRELAEPIDGARI